MKYAIQLQQPINDGYQEYYIASIEYRYIAKNSYVSIYGEDNYGYQRKINGKHLRKIRDSIKKNELISPTAILLAIDKDKVGKYLTLSSEDNQLSIFTDYFYLNESSDHDFRIIDGQHRMAGLKESIEDGLLKDTYTLATIIMVVENNERLQEIISFRNINGKAKPLRTDLAIIAEHEYKIKKKIAGSNTFEYISVEVAKKLNENDSTVMSHAIKIDPNNSITIGIVSFKAFHDSMKILCKNLKISSQIDDVEILNVYVDTIAYSIIVPCWQTVLNKWPECFKKHNIEVDGEKAIVYYNCDYYLQKTMGIMAINGLIADLFKDINDIEDIACASNQFNEIIFDSKIKSQDWKKLGRFDGLSSLSGSKKIKDMIKNID